MSEMRPLVKTPTYLSNSFLLLFLLKMEVLAGNLRTQMIMDTRQQRQKLQIMLMKSLKI